MTMYEIVDLGMPAGAQNSKGVALNDAGQVLCSSRMGGVRNHSQEQSFVWEAGHVTLLGRFEAKGINNRQQVIGTRPGKAAPAFLGGLNLPAALLDQACLFSHGKLQDLFTSPDVIMSLASSINDAGFIAGTQYMQEPPLYAACVWRGTDIHKTPQSLSAPHGFNLSQATGLNDKNQVVGEASRVMSAARHSPRPSQIAVLWDNDTAVLLPPLSGYTMSSAAAINNHGHVVGNSSTQNRMSKGSQYACLWQQGAVQELGALHRNGISFALDINDHAQIVGNAAMGEDEGLMHAFLWENRKFQDLNNLIPKGSGWTLISAKSINNRGQIVCNGVREHRGNSVLQAVLLQPK